MNGNARNKRRDKPPKRPFGLFGEFIVAVIKSLPELSDEQMKHWIGNQIRRGLLAKKLHELFLGVAEPDDAAHWRAEWTKFYKKVFNLDVNLSAVAIPDEREGFGWFVIALKDLTLNSVYAKGAKKYPSWKFYNDLDKSVPVNERDPNRDGTYAIRLRDRVEADEEFKNLSANRIAETKIPPQNITLLERLLLELWYFWKTGGQHLDVQSITLCVASRFRDGGVPRVDWDGSKLNVYCCSPDEDDAFLRSREAVS